MSYYRNNDYFDLSRYCNKIRAQHKEFETKNKIISYDKDLKPKVRETFSCNSNNTKQENMKMKKDLTKLKQLRSDYGRDCVGKPMDKGHKTIINQYSNKISKCNKILKKQK